MKRVSSILLGLFVLTSISACGQSEVALAPDNSLIQTNQTAALSVTKGHGQIVKGTVAFDSRKFSKIRKNYTFNRPTAIFFANLYTENYTPKFVENVKIFMEKFVSNRDIEGFEIVIQDRDTDIVNINFYGGQPKFLVETLIPDLNFYISQRSKFDGKSFRLETDKDWTAL